MDASRLNRQEIWNSKSGASGCTSGVPSLSNGFKIA